MPVLQLWQDTDDCSADITVIQNTASMGVVTEDSQPDLIVLQQILTIDNETDATPLALYELWEGFSSQVSFSVGSFVDLNASLGLVGESREEIKTDVSLSLEEIPDFVTDEGISGAFVDISAPLSLATGIGCVNISSPLSLIKEATVFHQVVLQKPKDAYVFISSANGGGERIHVIRAFNISPNKEWYIKFTENQGRTGVIIQLFATEGDATGETNQLAVGLIDFGLAEEVTLTGTGIFDTADASSWGYFSPEFEWHLVVDTRTVASHAGTLYKVKRFFDLDEVRDPIYENPDLITSRGTAEVNHHTYVRIETSAILGEHQPDWVVGDIAQYTSSRLGTISKQQVRSNQITGGVDQQGKPFLLNNVILTQYQGVSR